MTSGLQETSVDLHLEQALGVASEITSRYQISSIEPLLASCRTAIATKEITVAILGRFKAGKSTFINEIIGRNLLPVGVVPVTTVITEIRYGPVERAQVHFLDGRIQNVPVGEIAQYVSERENPENTKQVKLITVELPQIERFRGLRLVDTPGLESVLAHNTDASAKWLPNVGLALVAVSVDPPLSQRDVELVKTLYRFTPNVTILLTKVDLLQSDDRAEVIDFVRSQLAKAFNPAPSVLPYSARPGYEGMRSELETAIVARTLQEFGTMRYEIVARKVETALQECSDFVTLGLRSAELIDAERERLKQQVLGERELIADLTGELRLIANHATGGTRSEAQSRLDNHQSAIERELLTGFEAVFPTWGGSLTEVTRCYEEWLSDALSTTLAEASISECSQLVQRLYGCSRQFRRYLQEFRDRLSERTMRAFGVPLRTTEVDFGVDEPGIPDVRIGKIFDRSWELLSPILPMWLIEPIVKAHFSRKIPFMVYKNISRLASQWEEAINQPLLKMEKEAEYRLNELLSSVERLIDAGRDDTVSIMKLDLDQIQSARNAIARPEPNT